MKRGKSIIDQEIEDEISKDKDLFGDALKGSRKGGGRRAKPIFIFGDYYTMREIAEKLDLNYVYVADLIKRGYLHYLESYEGSDNQKKKIEKRKEDELNSLMTPTEQYKEKIEKEKQAKKKRLHLLDEEYYSLDEENSFWDNIFDDNTI